MSMRDIVIEKIIDLAMAQKRDRNGSFDVNWNNSITGAMEEYKKKAIQYEKDLEAKSDIALLEQLLGMSERIL